jgi:hypothetical protein
MLVLKAPRRPLRSTALPSTGRRAAHSDQYASALVGGWRGTTISIASICPELIPLKYCSFGTTPPKGLMS